MLIPHHMECNVCGAKSVTVSDRFQMTPAEKQALREFMAQHQECAAALEGFSATDAVSSRPDGWTAPQVGAFGAPKAQPRSALRPHGHFEYTGPYGETQIGDTVSCCHCRRHHEVRAGLEKNLGFCALCYDGTPGSGVTCGRPECQQHIPYELRLDNCDRGLPELTPANPQVSVPRLPAGFANAVLLAAPEPSPDLVESVDARPGETP
ncbi:MAG: hypothetical protein KGL39_33370 [Patescibacteria group bacterium]|nr:hypothetical protein [Patescibacteria group bacterium]